MENENILSIFCRTLYSSQGGDFLTSTWLMIGMKILVRNYEESIRI